MSAICSFICAILAVIFIVMLFIPNRTLRHSERKLYLAATICALEFLGGHWVLGLIWVGTSVIQALECKERDKEEQKNGTRIEIK